MHTSKLDWSGGSYLLRYKVGFSFGVEEYITSKADFAVLYVGPSSFPVCISGSDQVALRQIHSHLKPSSIRRRRSFEPVLGIV